MLATRVKFRIPTTQRNPSEEEKLKYLQMAVTKDPLTNETSPSKMNSRSKDAQQPKRKHSIKSSSRVVPAPLYSATTTVLLTHEQKELIQSIGFGSILDLGINEIPVLLGRYVVDNFNHETSSICLPTGKIQITRQSIHDLLAVPIGGEKIVTRQRHKKSDKVTQIWKQQFTVKNIRPSDVVEQLKENKYIQDKAKRKQLFVLNFLVLFTSCMIARNKLGTCNATFLPLITSIDRASQLDWCGYILDCLIEAGKELSLGKTGAFFGGSLSTLVLHYVDSTKCNNVIVPRKRPAITEWTTALLNQREFAELRDGGFGRGEILTKSTAEEEENESEQRQNTSKEEDYEEYVHSVYKRVLSCKHDFEDAVNRGLILYPENSLIAEMQSKMKALFGSHEPRDEDEFDESTDPPPILLNISGTDEPGGSFSSAHLRTKRKREEAGSSYFHKRRNNKCQDLVENENNENEVRSIKKRVLYDRQDASKAQRFSDPPNPFQTPADADLEPPKSAPGFGSEPRQDSTGRRKNLLVLDINGIVADVVKIDKDFLYVKTGKGLYNDRLFYLDERNCRLPDSDQCVFKRPYCKDFIQFCLQRFEVVIWSSKTPKNVKALVDILIGELKDDLLTVLDQDATIRDKGTIYTKPLQVLWKKYSRFNMKNTLLIDDSPEKSAHVNPPGTVICPRRYIHNVNIEDEVLGPDGELREYLEMVASHANIQEYVTKSPFVEGAKIAKKT